VFLPFDDKANPIRRAVIRRVSRYKPHCCPPGWRVSSRAARFAVPRQSVRLRHKRRPECEEWLDRYYPRVHWLARLVERRELKRTVKFRGGLTSLPVFHQSEGECDASGGIIWLQALGSFEVCDGLGCAAALQ